MTKPDNRTQAIAETIVAEALAKHGHAAPDPGRHLQPELLTPPRQALDAGQMRRSGGLMVERYAASSSAEAP